MYSTRRKVVMTAAAVILAIVFSAGTVSSQNGSTGAVVYVPAYSSIYHGDKRNEIYLTVTLFIRNTDLKHAIKMLSVDYYDSAGKLLHNYLKAPLSVKPLGTINFLVRESENRGGAGAKFIVRWKADSIVSRPLIESVMIGTRGQQGISFSSRGAEIAP